MKNKAMCFLSICGGKEKNWCHLIYPTWRINILGYPVYNSSLMETILLRGTIVTKKVKK